MQFRFSIQNYCIDRHTMEFPSAPWIPWVPLNRIIYQVCHSKEYCASSLSFQTVLYIKYIVPNSIYIKSSFPKCIEYQVCHSELPRFLWIPWITLDPTDPFGGLKRSGVSKRNPGEFGMTYLIFNTVQNDKLDIKIFSK